MTDSITCPHCYKTSFSKGDIKNKHCGNCGYHTDELPKFFIGQGYEKPLFITGMGWCGLNKYIFTWGVLHNMTKWGIGGRVCFDTKLNAELFYVDLINNGKNVEPPVVGTDGCTAIK